MKKRVKKPGQGFATRVTPGNLQRRFGSALAKPKTRSGRRPESDQASNRTAPSGTGPQIPLERPHLPKRGTQMRKRAHAGTATHTLAGPRKKIRPARDLLIIELSSNRPWQAEVGKEYHTSYFDIPGGAASLQYVDGDGNPGKVGTTKAARTGSGNYRVELTRALPHKYVPPASGRAIAMFRRVRSHHFEFMFFMPGDRDYNIVDRLLSRHNSSRTTIRRGLVPISAAKRAWRACPLA